MRNLKDLKQEIVYVPIDEITPYENNPRDNDEASEKLADVIKQFGFRSPIYVDADGVIINGHTRLKAAMMLGYKEVPVVYADDLTEAEVKAFRIADNRVAEFSDWDVDLLLEELKDLSDDFTPEDLGFDDSILEQMEEQEEDDGLDDYSDKKQWKSQGGYIANFFQLDRFKRFRAIQPWDIPKVEADDVDLPERFIAFHNMNWEETKRGLDPSITGVRFFEDDIKEDRFWKDMDYWVDRLKEYKCVVAPDFSTYYEMPFFLVMFNIYRTFLCAQVLQDAGIPVILPCRTFGDWKYGKYVDEWFPKGGYYAISTKGSMSDDWDVENVIENIDAIYEKLDPKGILIFGSDIENYDWEKWGDKKHIYDCGQF